MNSTKFLFFLLLISLNTSAFCISCACIQVKKNEKTTNNQRDVKNKFIGPQIRLGKRIHGNNGFNKLIKILKEMTSFQNSVISY
jgi:hypothetical protein